MSRFHNTLSFRLTLVYTLSFVTFFAIAFLGLYISIATIIDNEAEDSLRHEINEFRMLFKHEGLTALKYKIENEIQGEDARHEFIKLIDSKGFEIVSSDLTAWKDLQTDTQIMLSVLSTSVPVIETISMQGHEDGIGDEEEVKIIYGQIGPDLIIQIGESLEQKDDILDILLTALIAMFCLVAPLSSVIGWVLVKKAVWGIEEVSNAAIDIENGKLDRRVSVSGQRDEIQKLADTFNSMAARVQVLMTEMRELTDNIAHDLRSPLGRIRVNSEMALSSDDNIDSYRNACAETIEECDRLIQMINTSLDVAEAEAGIDHAKKEQLNLSALTQDACELFDPVAESKSIDMTVTLEPVCLISGNRQNLQRMIANVLDNALKYTDEGGKVDINVSVESRSTIITIEDTGIGIPAVDHQRVFDRFYRCDQSRSHDGCGLGLSFSRAVARAHGGDITLDSEPGQGTSFRITLPQD